MVITQVDRKGQNIQVIWIAIDIELAIVIKLGENLHWEVLTRLRMYIKFLATAAYGRITEMTRVKFYENIEDELFKFAVIISKTQNIRFWRQI